MVINTHVIAAAKAIMSMSQTKYDKPADLASAIVEKYVRLPRPDDSNIPADCQDGVLLYATEVLSLGLLWHGFHDAIREADGNRILNYWKFLLVVFKSTNHLNYSKEAVNLLFQYYYKLSERQKQQLLWSRCVNTTGLSSHNIPCDLHMEHLNRCLKKIIHSMGANVRPSAIVKAGKALGPVHSICQAFEEQTSHYRQYNDHPVPGFGKDLYAILNALETEQVFIPTPGREHKSFKAKIGLMEKFSKKDLIKKVLHSIKQLQP